MEDQTATPPSSLRPANLPPSTNRLQHRSPACLPASQPTPPQNPLSSYCRTVRSRSLSPPTNPPPPNMPEKIEQKNFDWVHISDTGEIKTPMCSLLIRLSRALSRVYFLGCRAVAAEGCAPARRLAGRRRFNAPAARI